MSTDPGLRVVSLVPSVTETLRAWGVTPVGVTRFCEQPDLPSVGGTKDPQVEAIVGLRPDLVVVDREENRLEDAVALRAAGLTVLDLHVTGLAGVAPALSALADAVGRPPEKVDAGPPAAAPVRPISAFVPIWRRPWMTINADTYGSTVLEEVGIRNVFGDATSRYPQVTLEEARARAPDLVLAPSEPYPFGERHRGQLEAVAPVVFVDGRDLFWWGVRTAGALRRLAALPAQVDSL